MTAKARTVKNAKRVREFYVIIEEGEDGYYVADVPQLHGCHTQGKTLDELMQNVKEVIALCLEDEELPEAAVEIKPPIIGIQKVAVEV